MVERIICRFRNKEDLDEFSLRNGFELTKDSKEIDVHTKNIKINL